MQVQLSGRGPWGGLWTLRGRLPRLVDEPVTYGKRAEGGPYAGRLVVDADTAHLHDPWYLTVSAGSPAGRPCDRPVAVLGGESPIPANYSFRWGSREWQGVWGNPESGGPCRL